MAIIKMPPQCTLCGKYHLFGDCDRGKKAYERAAADAAKRFVNVKVKQARREAGKK